MNVTVIDVGGTSVKVWGSGGKRLRKIRSGPDFTPQQLVDAARPLIEQDQSDAVSLGYPGKVASGRPAREPWNLGAGWVGFDFPAELGKPVRFMNDAAMQALGAYRGGSMLFMGLGTSVGAALVADGVAIPLELGNLPFSRRATLEDILSKRGLRRKGRAKWARAALSVLPKLQQAFVADYTVLGGGNAKLLAGRLPFSVRLGGNRDAYLGGVRLWQTHQLPTALVYHYEGEDEAEFAIHVEKRDSPPSAAS